MRRILNAEKHFLSLPKIVDRKLEKADAAGHTPAPSSMPSQWQATERSNFGVQGHHR